MLIVAASSEFACASQQRKYVVLSFDKIVCKYHYCCEEICAFYSFQECGGFFCEMSLEMRFVAFKYLRFLKL